MLFRSDGVKPTLGQIISFVDKLGNENTIQFGHILGGSDHFTGTGISGIHLELPGVPGGTLMDLGVTSAHIIANN